MTFKQAFWLAALKTAKQGPKVSWAESIGYACLFAASVTGLAAVIVAACLWITA